MTDKTKLIKIIAISDTHGLHRNITIPDGDIFIFAGDMSGLGKSYEIEDFALWLKMLPHKIKIVIAGNHDFLFETNPDKARNIIADSCIYLQDKQYDLYPQHLKRENEDWHVNFYGSPWQPRFYDWAFNIGRDSENLKNKWDKIPDNIDILITHGPPKGILDFSIEKCGCSLLLNRIKKIKPKLHIFGHIHDGYGVRTWYPDETTFINASIVDKKHGIMNKPVEIEYDPVERRVIIPQANSISHTEE